MVKPRQWQPMFNSNLGLKQGYAITNMPEGSCLDIKNMYLNGLGGKSPRNGYAEIFHLTNGVSGARITDRIRSLIQYNPFGGTSEVLAYAGTRIFKQSGTETAIVRSGLTDDAVWEWLQYRDLVLGVNGNDTSFLHSAASDVTISITAPIAHIGVTDLAAGSLNAGTYYYLVTFYDSTRARESNPFTVSTAPSVTIAASRQIRLSSFPTPTSGQGVDQYRIYRKRGAETAYTRIATINLAAVPYDDNDNVTGTIELVSDTGQVDAGNTPHPQSKLIAEQFDRIFMVDENDPSTLVYSRVGSYWAFPSGNFHYVGRGDGSRINRIEKHGKALLIHKENGWYILTGDPATNSPQFLSKIGTQDIHTSVSAQNQVVRLSKTGFYRSVPTDFSSTDLREDYIGNDVSTLESELDWSNSRLASMYSFNAANRRHVYYIEPLSASYYSKCLVYDIVSGEWVYYEIGTDIFSVADYSENNQRYMMMGDGYGIVWQWDQGGADGIDLLNTLLKGSPTSAAATTLTDTSKVDVSSTATGSGSGANTLADTTHAWTVNQWVGKPVYIVSGTGSGQSNTVSTNTATQLTCTSAWTTAPNATSVYTIGGWVVSQLIGCVVSTHSGTGDGQRRRITANTSYMLTVDTAWTTTPDTTTTYKIAAIDKYAEEAWNSNTNPHLWKRMRWIVPYLREIGDYEVEVSMRRDFKSGTTDIQSGNISLLSSGSLWGVFLWGVGTWGSSTTGLTRFRLHGKYHFYSIKYRNKNGGEPFYWDGHGAVFQTLYDRNK